jgi:hypothetical protein
MTMPVMPARAEVRRRSWRRATLRVLVAILGALAAIGVGPWLFFAR